MIELLSKLKRVEWGQFCSAVEDYSLCVQKERNLKEKLYNVSLYCLYLPERLFQNERGKW